MYLEYFDATRAHCVKHTSCAVAVSFGRAVLSLCFRRYVCDQGNQRIQVLDKAGYFVRTIGTSRLRPWRDDNERTRLDSADRLAFQNFV